MNNKNNKIIFCEKISQLQNTMAALANEGDIGIISPGTASYRFSYPQNIKYQEIPSFEKNPTYLNNCARHGMYGYILKDGEMVECKELMDYFKSKDHTKPEDYYISNLNVRKDEFLKKQEIAQDYITSFGEIVCATDPDLTGARAFQFYLEKYLNFYNYTHNFKRKNTKVSFLRFAALDKKSLITAYEKRENISNSMFFNSMIESYKKKDYFEYNFNINSLVLFGDILRRVGIYGDFIISKNILLTMMIMDEHDGITECNLITKMERNKIGQVCSRSEIITRLYKQGLLYKTEKIYNGKIKVELFLSDEGNEFLSSVHNKAKDPKLAIHLSEDITSDMSFTEFKEKYSEKLKIMFGKQKRYLRNN